MGYDNKRGTSFLAQSGHQLIEHTTVLAVKVAARFISKDKLRIIHQSPCNSDPLLFAA